MLTRSLPILALLASKPFVCSPQAMHADDSSVTDTSDSSTTGSTTESSTDSTATGPTDTTDSTSTGPAMCGNGVEDPGEECDDGNDSNEDACLNNCVAAKCGDEFVQTGEEECDDGDQIDTNSCTTACKMAACGDGIVWEGMETCDDGNDVDTDACTNNCTAPTCGDGVKQGDEVCDNGTDNQDPSEAMPDACTTACVFACGDGTKSSNEECDDANTVSADGCTAMCANDYPMFVTKDVFPANFTGVGGIADADAICQGAAEGKFTGTYVAWLSVGGDDAETDLPEDKPLVRTDGQLIVVTSADLVQGDATKLMNPIDRDEDGSQVMAPAYAWTATSPEGAYSGKSCMGWSDILNGTADIGDIGSTDPAWTNAPIFDPQIQCSATNHLYCFRKSEP